MKRWNELQRDAIRPFTVNQSYAVDECPALEIMYVGDEDSCEITIETDGDIKSQIGDVGSEANDTNFQVGSTAATIDVSDADADTFGEVADFINSLDDYVCILHAHPDDSSDDTLLAAAAAQAKWPSKVTGYIDSSEAKYHIHSFSARPFPPHAAGQLPQRFNLDDEMGHRMEIMQIYFTGVEASNWGPPTAKIYNIKGRDVDDDVVTVGWKGITSGNQWQLREDNAEERYVAKPGHRLLVKIENSTDWFTSITSEQAIGRRL